MQLCRCCWNHVAEQDEMAMCAATARWPGIRHVTVSVRPSDLTGYGTSLNRCRHDRQTVVETCPENTTRDRRQILTLTAAVAVYCGVLHLSLHLFTEPPTNNCVRSHHTTRVTRLCLYKTMGKAITGQKKTDACRDWSFAHLLC